MKKLALGGALAATVLGGSIAVAALTPIGAAFAGGKSQPVALEAGQASSSAPAAGGQAAKGPGRFQQALDDLVKDGTITQDQADKIKQKLESTIGKRGGRPGPGGPGAGLLRPGLDAVAKSIGIPTADLQTALKSGQTIAAVAQAHGVDPQKVINDLTAQATTKIDQAVSSGKLQKGMADKIKANLGDSISKLVNGSFHGFPGGRGPGRGAPGTNSGGGSGSGGTTGGSAGLGGGTAPSATAAPTTTDAPATSDTTAAQPSGTLGG